MTTKQDQTRYRVVLTINETAANPLEAVRRFLHDVTTLPIEELLYRVVSPKGEVTYVLDGAVVDDLEEVAKRYDPLVTIKMLRENDRAEQEAKDPPSP